MGELAVGQQNLAHIQTDRRLSEKKSKGKTDLVSSPVPDQVVIRNKHLLDSEEKKKEKRQRTPLSPG